MKRPVDLKPRHPTAPAASHWASLLLLGLSLTWFSSAALAQQARPPSADPQASASAEQVETPGDGRQGAVKTVLGEVTVVQGNSRSLAVPGHPVRPGDRIVTGTKSSASLILRDGSVLSIGPDSSIELSQFKFDSTTHDGNMLITLTHGTLRVVTGLIAKLQPEQVKVTTPTTVIGVRGTDFIVEQKP